MAAPKGIYALNLGTQTISLAEFMRSANGGLILTRLKQGEVAGDPGADAARTAQTKLQIQQLAQELQLKGAKTNYAIASHVIFTRPVTLPSVGDASQVEQIVGFEAQQNVPYPIAEVVWDWQLLDAGAGGQVEVILAAIKADLLDEINGAVCEGGVVPDVIDIAPMALYNAFRYNYPEVEGCSIIVDIGSRTTNLLFCEPGKIFPRRLNIGGSSITTAIAKDFGCTFAEAEERKVKDGFVSLGGTYAEHDDPEIARISKITRNQMTRLHQEIARSITFYRSEHGGSQPQRVLICGGTASFPYIREFFQEKFPGLEVDFFNPLRNVAVSDSMDVEALGRKSHTLGELVGLALRAAGSCPMELNLRPLSLVKAEKRAAQRPFIIAAGVCALTATAAWWQYFERAATATEEEAAALTSQAAPLSTLKEQMDKARKEIASLSEFGKPLAVVARERTYWSDVLADLNSRLPADYIWITGLEVSEEKPKEPEPAPVKPGPGKSRGGKPEEPPAPIIVAVARGLYLSREAGNPSGPAVVDEFIAKLKESPLLEPIEDAEAGYMRANDDTPEWAFKFVLPLKLKTPISIL